MCRASTSDPPRLVRVGIDAAVVAQHEVCVRATALRVGSGRTGSGCSRPWLGLRSLSNRLAEMPGVIAVAEPTSMTWLGLSVALAEAGCGLSLLGARHAARLRGAISGKHKSDVIDADVLARAGEVFDLHPLRRTRSGAAGVTSGVCPPRDGGDRRQPLCTAVDQPGPVGVPGCVERVSWLVADRGRGTATLAAPGATGCGPPLDPDGGGRVAHPRGARRAGTGGGDPLLRCGVDVVWDGHLVLDALAFDVTEHVIDMAYAKARIERATAQAQRYWSRLYGDDELLMSIPGIGPVTACIIRGFLADGTPFANAKAAASYVGLNPSTWSSGTASQPSRAITKEGPAVLRLAFFQAANAARRQDPQLASFYHRLMTQQGHCHTQACVAVARKLVERTWTVLTRGPPTSSAAPTASRSATWRRSG
jgi:hypothetical protein